MNLKILGVVCRDEDTGERVFFPVGEQTSLTVAHSKPKLGIITKPPNPEVMRETKEVEKSRRDWSLGGIIGGHKKRYEGEAKNPFK